MNEKMAKSDTLESLLEQITGDFYCLKRQWVVQENGEWGRSYVFEIGTPDNAKRPLGVGNTPVEAIKNAMADNRAFQVCTKYPL